MFDDVRTVESGDTEARLRRNLKGFDRDSLKVLHPVFHDALRLLTRRHFPDKSETLLLPLVRTDRTPRVDRCDGAVASRVERFPAGGVAGTGAVRLGV